MQAKLIVVEGKTQTTEITLKLPMVVGRGRSAALKVAHALVSREHCELFESDGTLMVRDMGSLNGTYVDGERIEGTAPLNPGQLLTIGDITFRAEYLDAKGTQAGAKDETAVGKLPVPSPAASSSPVAGSPVAGSPVAGSPVPSPPATQPIPFKVIDEPLDGDILIEFGDAENTTDVSDFDSLPLRTSPRKKG